MITQEEVKRLFDYDPNFGMLYLRSTGRRVGWVEASQGYRRVKVGSRRVMEHVVIWLWMTGEYAVKGVDHRNLNTGDNRWENLRRADARQQSANRRVKRDNRLGVKGVRFHECGKYQARIYDGRRFVHLGLFEDVDAAKRAYDDAASRLFGEFARSA